MAERFFTADTLGPGEYELAGAEAHHLATVRRIAAGDRITLFNGDGNEYAAEVIGMARKAVTLRILSAAAVDRELPFPLIVAAALPKGDRTDILIEKLTELGVTRFVPLITTRSVVTPKETAVAKWTRVVVEASKQCGRNRLMVVEPPVKLSELLGRDATGQTRLLFHTTVDSPRLGPLSPHTGFVAAIGPEGGFTLDEVVGAVECGWKVCSLGPRILRVETAAICAAALAAVCQN